MNRFTPQGRGWIPDLPDARDYTYRHDAVRSLLVRLQRPRSSQLPNQVDLRSDDEGVYLSPVEDQGPLNSSAAFAVLSMVEYFERRARGRTFHGSRLFLYKVTRNRLQEKPVNQYNSHSLGDTGADLRTTLKTLVHFGVPPEKPCPYEIERFDQEPSQYLYGLARPFSGLRYFRLDEPNCDGAATWQVIKSFLAAGFPIAFGFSIPESLTADADIPYRPDVDAVRGGQAALAIGYKEDYLGCGQDGLLMRVSWGSDWGEQGYGWLPVGFIRSQLARDFWTIASEKWLDPTEISLPTVMAADLV